jgi:hypothetical protein
VDQLDHDRRQEPRQQRAKEHRPRPAALAEDKRDHEPGQDAVADGVAHQREATEQQVIADEAAGRGHKEAHEHDPAKGIEVGRPRRDHDALPVKGGD